MAKTTQQLGNLTDSRYIDFDRGIDHTSNSVQRTSSEFIIHVIAMTILFGQTRQKERDEVDMRAFSLIS